MRNDLLFIDGELVDLDDETKITLNIRSNIFSDLSKIVSNNSYTIKLPKTVRNQRIIQHSDLPACNTNYARRYHDARYFRNGIEIIPKAKAVLISVSDSIEIAMTWGNFTAFSKVITDGITLNEIGDINNYHVWDAFPVYSDYGVENIMIANVDFGLKANDDHAACHPSVRATYILEMIKSKYGLEFVFPEREATFINTLIIPLLTRNGGYANELSSLAKMKQRTVQTSGSGSEVYWNNVSTGEDFGKMFIYLYTTSGTIVSAVKLLVDGTVVLKPDMKSSQNDLVVFYGDSSVYNNRKVYQLIIEK